MRTCIQCGIEFEAKRDTAKYCSPKCRVTASRNNGVVTPNVTLSEPDVTLKFKFTVTYNKKPGDPGYDSGVDENRKKIREAIYWYDVPLAAVPVIQKGWPEVPVFKDGTEPMNGRQYFLWWKNEFAGTNENPVILNPTKSSDLPLVHR